MNASIQSHFNGSPQEFQQGLQTLTPHIAQHGLDPNVLAAQYPEDTARMVQATLEHPEEIQQAQVPLYRASELGHASQVKDMLTFMPVEPKQKNSHS